MEDAKAGKYFAATHRLEEKYGFGITYFDGAEPQISGEQLEALFDKMPEVVKNAYPSNIKPELDEIVEDADKYEIISKANVRLAPQKIVPAGSIEVIENALGKAIEPVTELYIPGHTVGSLSAVDFPERTFRLIELSEQGTEDIKRILKEIPKLDSLLKANVDINTRIYGESDKGSRSIIYNIECIGTLDGTDFSSKEVKEHSYGADKGLWEVLCYVKDMERAKRHPLEIRTEEPYQAGNINLKDAVQFCELAMK